MLVSDWSLRQEGNSSWRICEIEKDQKNMTHTECIRTVFISTVLALTGVSGANAALIGVDWDFAGGATPTNWTLDSNSGNHTLLNLIDETGAATGVDLSVNPGAGVMVFSTALSPRGSCLPTRTLWRGSTATLQRTKR